MKEEEEAKEEKVRCISICSKKHSTKPDGNNLLMSKSKVISVRSTTGAIKRPTI